MKTGIVERLRKHAGTLHGPQNDDMRQAADMIEVVLSSLRCDQPKMNGKHYYRFRNGGWPLANAIGSTAEDALLAVVEEVNRERSAKT